MAVSSAECVTPSKDEKTIFDLPDELMIHILSFLSSTDLSATVAKVCTSWLEYALTPSLWRVLDYKCTGDRRAEERDWIFTHVPILRCLSIEALHCVDSSALLSALEGRNLTMTKLFLAGRRLENDFFEKVRKHFSGIEKLVLKDVRLQYQDYVTLGGIQTLHSLEFGGDRISWVGLRELVSSCPQLSSLQVGALCCHDECEEHEDQEQPLFELLCSVSCRLTECHLLGPLALSDRILCALENCASLRALEVTDCTGINGDGLLSGVLKLSHLVSLTLRDMRHVPFWILHQFFCGSQMTQLKHLDIAACTHLENDCLQEISVRFPSLESLNIRGCENITDAGVFEVLAHCTKLHSIELWGLSKLSGACFELFPHPLLPRLKLIDVRYCPNIPNRLLGELENSDGRRVLW